MKVLNLCCSHGHNFEGWFASEADFLSQQARHLVSCPVCNDAQVERRPSAPRLNLSTRRGEPLPAAAPAPATPTPGSGSGTAPEATPAPETVQAAFLQAVRQVLSNTEDVGERFAEEARRIHYGESESRGIRGQATSEEREALRDEGIEVYALPVPEALKGPQH